MSANLDRLRAVAIDDHYRGLRNFIPARGMSEGGFENRPYNFVLL